MSRGASRCSGASWWWLLGALAAGCGGDDPYLSYQEFYTRQGTETLVGRGCILSGAGATGSAASGVAGGGPGGMQPYSVEYVPRDQGISVIVRNGNGGEIARRDYTNAFLEAGGSDDVVVDLAEDTLRLHYVGTSECPP